MSDSTIPLADEILETAAEMLAGDRAEIRLRGLSPPGGATPRDWLSAAGPDRKRIWPPMTPST